MKSKWRSIIVNQQNYKWRIEDITIYGNLLSNKLELILFFKIESNNNSQATVKFTQPHFVDQTENSIAITPALVTQCINYALEKGWKPDSSNQGIRFDNGYELWIEYNNSLSSKLHTI